MRALSFPPSAPRRARASRTEGVAFRVARALAFLAVGATALTVAQTAPAEAPEISVSVDRSEILVGEPVVCTIALRWPATAGAPALSVPETLGAFEVLEHGVTEDRKAKDGRFERTVTLKLISFELGEQELPPIEVTYMEGGTEAKTAKTPPQRILVNSVLEQTAAGGATDLRPIRPPMEWPRRGAGFYVAILGAALLAVLLCMGLVWLLRRWLRPREREATGGPPPLPPDEEALHALAEMEMMRMAEREAAKPYYTRLSEILRRYLGRRYGFDGLEM
ncbi:MAG TPA: BatD family protein, partial [Sumerlaeia bacterium]|nr:BatD family protein [Sumerlaeia bacterium]